MSRSSPSLAHWPNFNPHPLLGSAHLQTLWPSLFRQLPSLERTRERFELPDGDFIDLDWCVPPETRSNTPIGVLFHGLTGSSNSQYIVAMQAMFTRQGWRSVAVNFRASSGVPNRRPQVYHAGHTDDIDALFAALHQRFPSAPLTAIGYSLGGSMLGNWLGKRDYHHYLSAAALVSVPYDLGQCSTRLDQGFSRLYRRHMLNALQTLFTGKLNYFRALGDSDSQRQLERLSIFRPHTSFWTFDDEVMAPLHGFTSVHDYYNQCSAGRFLGRVTTPTLLIQSLDDPFVPTTALPSAEKLSAQVHTLLQPKGGHLGFWAHRHLPRRGPFWLELTLWHWLEKTALPQATLS